MNAEQLRRNREAQARWREANRERSRAHSRAWKQRHREQINAYAAQRRRQLRALRPEPVRATPEQRREAARAYDARYRQSPEHQARAAERQRQWRARQAGDTQIRRRKTPMPAQRPPVTPPELAPDADFAAVLAEVLELAAADLWKARGGRRGAAYAALQRLVWGLEANDDR